MKLLNQDSVSRIEAAQIALLFSRARLVYLVNVVNAGIAAFFLSEVVPQGSLVGWLLALTAITAQRFHLLREYERDEAKAGHLERWKRVAVWGALASGMAWGLAAIVLFPVASLLHQIFLLVVIVGMMAGAVASWNAYFPAFQAYFLPVVTLTLLRVLLETSDVAAAQAEFASLGVMFVVFSVALYFLAWKSSQLSVHSLRTQFEKELGEARYRALFKGSKAPMLLIDPSCGRIVDANAAASTYYGYTQEQLEAMNIAEINTLSAEEIARKMANASQEQEFCFHFKHKLAGGEVRDVEVHSGPINWTGQRLLYSIIHDITERVQAEQALQREVTKTRTLFRTAADGLHILDEHGNLLESSDSFCRMLGYTPQEMRGMNVRQWDVSIANGPSFEEMVAMIPDEGLLIETKQCCKDGRQITAEVHATTVTIHEQRFVYASSRDITERKRAEESLRLAASIYQSSSEAIMVTDVEGHIVEVNPAFTRITGYGRDEVAGQSPLLLHAGQHDEDFYRQLRRAVDENGHWQGEMWARRKSGEPYAQWANISAIKNADGSVTRYVSQFSDITERKRKDELIWRQANYDTLTNLPNRRLFRDRLERDLKKSNRNGWSLALLFIDLDRFKEVNDTLGHDKGDLLLMEAALRISQCVRETDTVARLGGDEFTVILSGFDSRVHLERIAQNIIAELARPFELGSDNAYISASIGITLYPDDALDLEGLLKSADQAMYGAKAMGRNRYGYFTESMQREAQEKLSLTNDLRQALARGELEVYYQPIVNAASGRIVKAEALLRWKHQGRGMISPDLFIPLAEESGLILEIGDWVFRQSIASVQRWRDKFGSLVPISVNKSPVQFSEESVGKEWMEALSSRGLPGNSIAVEITEGLLLKDIGKVRQRLMSFQNQGIEVSIDDFGTGFSSLSYLNQFDINYLKIDRSFISSLTERESDQALVEAIIVMAHKLGIKTIAEGVETAQQRDLLIAFGCDYAQGFFYSRAVSIGDFESLLEKCGAEA
ncbi:MAG: EAL domain-containing protein [Nitrosomonadales bacterium]|nr:EAL domain-containing protein [Nitrosomonadales bacterium]